MIRVGLTRFFVVLSVAALGSAAISRAATITFSDDTFDDASWTATGIGPGLLSFTAGQVPTGGNPGSFRQNTLTFNFGFVYVVNLGSAFDYDPSLQGAIFSVSASYDVILIGPYAVGYGLALLQNGSYYISHGSSALGPNWAPGEDLASSFTQISGSGPLIPDFSATGAPIEFGYVSMNYDTLPGTTLTSQSGIDNLSIVLNAPPPATGAPEPPSVSLLTAAMVLMVVGPRLQLITSTT
jgi:hypothetical protein